MPSLDSRQTAVRLATALGAAIAMAVLCSVTSQPACANDWDSDHGRIDTSMSLIDVRIDKPTQPGAKRWVVAREVRFRGKVLSPSWHTFSDGTKVRLKTGLWGGKRLLLSKQGSLYLSETPHFDDDAITWKTVDYRRPLPIQGALRVKYDILEKVSGRPAQWDCSIYYYEVCRWFPGRRAVPKHRIGGIVAQGYLTTDIGPDRYAGREYLGQWTRPLDQIPVQIMTNPTYPIWNSGTDMYGHGPLNNSVTIRWKHKDRRTA